MTVAELIAELQTKDPAARVVVDYEAGGWEYLGEPDGVQDVCVKPVRVIGGDYDYVDEGTEGAVKAVRIW